MFVDTAGRERFDTIVPMIYHKADIIMLVYDITNRSSFESLTKWLNDIDHHKGKMETDDIKMMLIGNKKDLEGRRVSFEEGMKLAKEKRMCFFETSAKTGKNINEAFEHMVKELVESVRLQDDFKSFRYSATFTKTTTVRLKRRCCFSSASKPEQPKLNVVTGQRNHSSSKRSGRHAANRPINILYESLSTPREFTHILMLTSYS